MYSACPTFLGILDVYGTSFLKNYISQHVLKEHVKNSRFFKQFGGISMDMKGMKLGIALTGSFCTFDATFNIIKQLVKNGADVTPIISYNVDLLDTRFWLADDVKQILIELTGKKIIKEITTAEPVGPKNLFDVLTILPCTGNTLAKLASAITDTPVLMAAKSQLRNKKPVVIAVSTNDGLSNNATNIGKLMNTKNIYFVPFSQDDPIKKELSTVFLENRVIETIIEALNQKQIQPVIC